MTEEGKPAAKDEKKDDSGTSLLTVFLVSVAGGLTAHAVARLFERRTAPAPELGASLWDE